MKRTIALLCLMLALSACSSQKDEILTKDDQEEQRENTEHCLDNPKLSRNWGECNAKKMIFDNIPKIRQCYKSEGSKEYDYHGDLILKIKVWGSGKVRSVKIEEGSLKNRMLSGCLIKEISRIKFAPPPANVNPVIIFPFSLDIVKP